MFSIRIATILLDLEEKMKLLSIRGATTVEIDEENTIREACSVLAKRIFEENHIKEENIITIFVTMTSDLKSLNASTAIRSAIQLKDVAFFSSQEPEIEGMLPRCIRVLVQCYLEKEKHQVKHIYMNEASRLRPDLEKIN
jgi:chorismate mutase